MTYPTLGADGSVGLGCLQDHEALWVDCLSKGAVMVETSRRLGPLQQVQLVLSGGALTAPVSLKSWVAFTDGSRAMLRFKDAAPEVLASLAPPAASAGPASVAAPAAPAAEAAPASVVAPLAPILLTPPAPEAASAPVVAPVAPILLTAPAGEPAPASVVAPVDPTLLTPSAAAAASASVSVTPAAPEVPVAPPTLEAGDQLVFPDTPSFVATRRDLLNGGTVAARGSEAGPRAEAWIAVRVGPYSHPVLLAARVEPRPDAVVMLHFVKGPQFAREMERIDAAVGVRVRRPRSGLMRSALDDLRSSGDRARSSPSSAPPAWEPVAVVPLAYVVKKAEPTPPAEVPPPPYRPPVDEEPGAGGDQLDAEPGSPAPAGSAARATPPAAGVATVAQQLARMKRSGDFANPSRAADLLTLPASRAPTDAELARPSSLLLFRWLTGLATAQLGEFSVDGKVMAITILGRNQLRTDTPISTLAKLLSFPRGTYKIVEQAPTAHLPHSARTQAVMVEIVRYQIRSFAEADLQSSFGARRTKSPALKLTGEKVIERMDFTPPLERTAMRMLHGQHTVDEVLLSGIGPKAGWEILYLLELFGALSWV